MANKYIYFLIIVIAYSKLIETYFLNDDLGTNLPERFGDAIDENWQARRSVANDYSSFSKEFDNVPNIDKESNDFDYRNGNAETQYDEVENEEKLAKREINKRNSYERLDDEDIKQILSKFSDSDREALDRLMNEKITTFGVDKRELLKRNFENNFHFNKRNNRENNFKMHCKGLRCEEYDQIPLRNEPLFEEDTYNQCPEKEADKRKLIFKRSNAFRPTSHENILQAKISLLKDNYKRSSEMRSLEDSAKKRSNKNRSKTRYRQKRSPDKESIEE